MIRTLHCSTNIKNYNLCLDFKVAGFTHRGPESGDIIYLLFKEGKKSYCGARFELDSVTDEKPWDDADNYVLSYSVKNIEFCNFFDMSFLGEIGGKYWALKYLQSYKAFDKEAADTLNTIFNNNKNTERQFPKEIENEIEDEVEAYSDEEIRDIEKTVPEQKINIMGTFQTINFLNETDSFRGLEKLVTENFYNLFPQYREENSILIANNRLFKTHLMNEPVNGVPKIPDALLITFDEKRKCPIHISLVEYECYGEGKTSPSHKSKYMNSHIIPQLMQFASSFSIITDQKTRDTTIQDWIDKIVIATDDSYEKIDNWMKKIEPNINIRMINSTFEKKLRDAFKEAIHVFLIIDELSGEQKETIKNIIQAFKLETGADIQFDSAIVKLVQKINLLNENFEFGLTAQ